MNYQKRVGGFSHKASVFFVYITAGLELQSANKDETIIRLETQVKELNARLKELKQSHQVELQEANVRLQQEMYLAKHFKDSSGTTTVRPKHRAKSKNIN